MIKWKFVKELWAINIEGTYVISLDIVKKSLVNAELRHFKAFCFNLTFS